MPAQVVAQCLAQTSLAPAALAVDHLKRLALAASQRAVVLLDEAGHRFIDGEAVEVERARL